MERIDKCIFAVKKGFTYSKETGVVYSPKGVVITKKINGYISLSLYVNKKRISLYAHQFAWFIINNEVVELIDHKNNIKTDNSISNLRKTTKQVNALNKSSKGCFFDKRSGKWEGRIMVNGKGIYLGRYNTQELATIEYNKYKQELISKLCK